MRLVVGGAQVEVVARDAEGHERPVSVAYDQGTALLRFDLEPNGLALRIRAL